MFNINYFLPFQVLRNSFFESLDKLNQGVRNGFYHLSFNKENVLILSEKSLLRCVVIFFIIIIFYFLLIPIISTKALQ